MKIRLSKALVFKKRIGTKIGEVAEKLRGCNSYNEEFPPVNNAHTLYAEWMKLSQLQIAMKTAINEANRAIQTKIYSILEMKSEVALLETIPTTACKQANHYAKDEKDKYTVIVAKLSEQYIENMTKALQKNIDALQEDLDAHNASTVITLPEEFDSVIDNL